MKRADEGSATFKDRVTPSKPHPRLTSKEHLFTVGNVELCIKAGTDIVNCLEDVTMFTSEVSAVLTQLCMVSKSPTIEFLNTEVAWGMVHLLDLANGTNKAALEALLNGGSNPSTRKSGETS